MKNKAAQQLGRLGGKATSAAKAAASRLNGKKGGRPKKKKSRFENSRACKFHSPRAAAR